MAEQSVVDATHRRHVGDRVRAERGNGRIAAPRLLTPDFRILFVCTGNVCRSPLGERIARASLDGVPDVQVTSAGTRTMVGSAMHPHSAQVLQELGGHSEGFTARQLEAASLASADLVLCMTREHRRTALALAPLGLARTFTLLEAADLVRTMGDMDVPGDAVPERARGMVRALVNGRSRRRSGAADDVADPIGQSLPAHRETGEIIAQAVCTVLQWLVADAVPVSGPAFSPGPRSVA